MAVIGFSAGIAYDTYSHWTLQLTGLALGAVLRYTASTVITSVVVTWLRLVEDGDPPTLFPWTTGGAWTVYAVWACAACAIAVTSVHRRDQ